MSISTKKYTTTKPAPPCPYCRADEDRYSYSPEHDITLIECNECNRTLNILHGNKTGQDYVGDSR